MKQEIAWDEADRTNCQSKGIILARGRACCRGRKDGSEAAEGFIWLDSEPWMPGSMVCTFLSTAVFLELLPLTSGKNS